MDAMEESGLDKRLNAYREDLASSRLAGKVEAKRFVEGWDRRVAADAVYMRGAPGGATLTQMLHGEDVEVYEEVGGWSWVQSARDGYVGYVETGALGEREGESSWRVSGLRACLRGGADVKAEALGWWDATARFTGEEEGDYVRVATGRRRGCYVSLLDAAPLDARWGGFVESALLYMNAPYVWGGRSSLGLDCSALIQNALELSGVSAPRDADMQEAAGWEEATGQEEGDVLFWKGHVGVVLGLGEELLHANAWTMRTSREDLGEALERLEKAAGPITSRRRAPRR